MTFLKIKTSKELWRVFSCSLVVNTFPSNAGDAGSAPGQGTKFPQAMGLAKIKKTTKNVIPFLFIYFSKALETPK